MASVTLELSVEEAEELLTGAYLRAKQAKINPESKALIEGVGRKLCNAYQSSGLFHNNPAEAPWDARMKYEVRVSVQQRNRW